LTICNSILNLLTYFISIFLLFSFFLVTIYAFPLTLAYIFPFFFFLFALFFNLVTSGSDVRSAFCECSKRLPAAIVQYKYALERKTDYSVRILRYRHLHNLTADIYLFACCNLSCLLHKAFPRIFRC